MYGNYSSAYPEKKPVASEIEESAYVKDIQDFQNLKSALLNYKIVVVKAWAQWCQPCKLAKQKLDGLAEQLKDYISNNYIFFLSDNIDSETSVHKKMVDVVPTFFIYFRGGFKPTHVFTGVEFDKLVETIQILLSQPDNEPVITNQPPPINKTTMIGN